MAFYEAGGMVQRSVSPLWNDRVWPNADNADRFAGEAGEQVDAEGQRRRVPPPREHDQPGLAPAPVNDRFVDQPGRDMKQSQKQQHHHQR